MNLLFLVAVWAGGGGAAEATPLIIRLTDASRQRYDVTDRAAQRYAVVDTTRNRYEVEPA